MKFMKDLLSRLLNDRVLDLSAQCAYYFLFSIFPFLIFMIALVGFLPFTSDDVLKFVSEHMPGQTNELIEENIRMVVDVKRSGTLSLSLLVTLWSASRGMDAVVYGLNRSYQVKEKRSFIRSKLLSMILTVGMIFVFLTALVLTVFGEKAQALMLVFLHIPENNLIVSTTFRWAITLIVVTITFIALYYIAPNTCIRCKDVVPGAVIAAVGWQLASVIFSFYVNRFENFSATYGSLGGLIILMTWFYLSALIIMMGGTINALLPQWKNE
ncbi:ribonuclease BN [Ammoniphilus oxalaticus]|uniref:Ribonuclease BN n=1 Tax=Ammoniphilus oxalaticus TaxID=66863 RepID=A0A419SKD6_9BACL|nr:YihY/virulence factor BrkB family protein [Ammoniphilus oxalaticus]RKD24399.1 ribonuclease BN [Ammoniphilus oxalaticus]